ncbi:MAG TPA: diiron oxygenase [Candidatus Binataceae bacterium]|nr:diiron oxygenase [Candidatus Binataceae bacterium]
METKTTIQRAGELLGLNYEVPEEERIGADARTARYLELIRRLSHQSVVKHFDAYADIDWDSPEYKIDPDDPRFELGADDVLGGTQWYRSLPAGVRSRIGLQLFATFMKIGVMFENVLKRGLLGFALDLPNGSPEFRYCYHEAIEEAQHSLMFQEFVNRTGLDLPGLNGFWDRLGTNIIISYGRRFPELFFVFVLCGEDPIDHVQRQLLHKRREEIHPLLRRIMQIHVTEEARHLSFARHYLRRHVPGMGAWRKANLAFRAPLILGGASQMMMQASPSLIRDFNVPKEVVDEAYRKNPVHRQHMYEATSKLRGLCVELGLVNKWSVHLWRACGIWPANEMLPEPATA